jgi:peptidoglycan/LPS O-acetylase OafA/YrhL
VTALCPQIEDFAAICIYARHSIGSCGRKIPVIRVFGRFTRRLGIIYTSSLARNVVRRDRSDGIDVIRAVFALWVMLAHLTSWTAVAQGPDAVPSWLDSAMSLLGFLFQKHSELNPAVLGFIVLSGYCIHRNGLRAKDSRALTIYAIKRCFRIIPVFYIGIIAGLIGFLVAGRHSASLAIQLSGTREITLLCVVAKTLAVTAIFPGFHYCAFLGNAPLITVVVEIVLYIGYAVARLARTGTANLACLR